MPFASKAQESWAFATHQPFAAKWEDLTDKKGGYKRLPERVKPKKRRSQDVHIKVALAGLSRREPASKKK